MTRRRAVPALALALTGTALAFLLGWAAPAGAHAVLLESDPAEGAVLDMAPSAVELSFNEPVRVDEDAVVVMDPSGTPLDGVSAAAVDRTVRIELPYGLSDGTHVGSLRIISADSHPMDGALTCSIGAPSSTAPTVPTGSGEPGWGFTVGRGIVTSIGYLRALGAAGLWFFRLLVHDG